MGTQFDAIIIGAGAVGSAAAYHAARKGYKVLLLEQYQIDHQHGSSHGASRIIRYAYDHPTYVSMARAAFPMWHELEEEAGDTLYTQTGGLDIGLPDEPMIRGMAKTLRATDVPYEILTAIEAQQHFPQFFLPEEMQVLYQADAGILEASKCVRAHVRLALQHGATVKDNSPVTRIEVHTDSVTVTTPRDRYAGATLMVVPGSWGKQLFASIGLDLPLVPVRAQENYFEGNPTADYQPGRFPTFIFHDHENYGGFMPYGLPSINGSGLKIGLHSGATVDNLDTLDRTPDAGVIEQCRNFMMKHLPGGNGTNKSSRACLYTMTPDEHFIIDQHPEYPHIAISASCSGHAFKFSTLIGSMLCDLAFKGETKENISLFSLSRFGIERAGV
jgi:monomeric sarcosine oxidase